MTEYELMDLSATYAGTAISALMGYFTVLSAYFIVAYAVGTSLNRSQVIAVNGLFLVIALFMIWGSTSYFYVSYDYRTLAGGLDVPVAGWKVALPLLLIGAVSGLKFMRDIRHPKPD
jgi:TRAP-type C4-dicarboxylate transport system permease small subunit